MLFLSIIILGMIGLVCLYLSFTLKDVKSIKNYKLQKWLSRFKLSTSKLILALIGIGFLATSILEFIGWMKNKRM
jgi:uncharacterized membrane protein HdeD (DUF308 family)